MQRGAYVLALLVTVGAVSAWLASYTQNVNLVQQMDEVTIEVNSESASPEKVEEQSKEIATNLMELAINIELVNPPDPAGRLSR